MNDKKDDMITYSQFKKEYNLTDKIIKEFFSEPDEYVENPMYKHASPMKLYSIKRIKKIMKTKKFQKAFDESLKRKESAKKAVETKTNKTIDDTKKKIKKIKVTILDISDEKLRSIVIKDWEKHKREMALFYERYDEIISGDTADSDTIDRWTVNYIRHNLTDYDYDLYNMKGKTGKHDAYIIYKEAVLKKIAKAYPKYKKECKRQIDMYKSDLNYTISI